MCRSRLSKHLEKQSKNAGKAHIEELDQIVGNAEDDIGDHIADVREREMLYGANSILATFGPMIVHICGTPKRYKASRLTIAPHFPSKPDPVVFRIRPSAMLRHWHSASLCV